MNHVYLIYQPNGQGRPNTEGYFDFNNQKITLSESNDKESFQKISVWKKILNNLIKSGLINKNWRVVGCPPSCEKDSNAKVQDILNQKNNIQNSSEDSLKKKETDALVRSFMTQQAIQNKNSNMMGYMYRYGESNENKDVNKTLRKLPKDHFDLIKKYKIQFEPNNTLKGDSDHIGFIDEEKKKIKVAAPWRYGREFTLLHEIAHAVWKYKVSEEKKKEWSKIIKNTKNKQKQNNEELFCMAYANYYSRHKVEIHNHEKWNNFIKSL
jgi:hypothetical protein